MKQYYDNRELSWLKFNERVLEEAQDKNVPLCERLMFTAIFQSNLDEFFMVRVGSLYDQTLVDADVRENKTDMTCAEQLEAIFKRVAELNPIRDNAYNGVMSELEKHGVEQVNFKMLSKEEESYLKVYFTTEILPLISPQVIDKRHPFPFLKNKEIYAVAQLEAKNSVTIGLVPASGTFSRIIFLPGTKHRFMLVEELILHYMPLIFENYKVLDKSLMRITRNADINMEEALYDHDVDLRDVMSDLLKKRKKLSPVRMELSRKLGQTAVAYLCEKLELKQNQIFRLKTPLDLSFVYALRGRLEDNLPLLFFGRADPQNSCELLHNAPIIPQVQKRDIVLSYPFESIKPFLRMLMEAAVDPNVVSIKITLYRVASNSKVIDALIAAAENGKEVLVLVELRARFDEENNIGWSKKMEEAGVKIIYGLEALKVHSKLMLITRKTGNTLKYFTQIGTGNYNEKTSELYTDLSLITANPDIASEALEVFNALSLGHLVEDTEHLLVAPLSLQNKIIKMIDNEIAHAKAGEKAFIGIKINSLSDKKIIEKLVEASQAGVKTELIIRGICCLISKVKGQTENIRITSIVGRFLEHSRIYIFGTEERRKMYISSADFMTRNTIKRVEVAVPIYDSDIQSKIMDIFNTILSDNVKARVQYSNGLYKKKNVKGKKLNSQLEFINRACKNAELITAPATEQSENKNVYEPSEFYRQFLMQ